MKNIRDQVVRRRDACIKFRDGTPSSDRKEALQFYRGDNLDLYGDSGDGLSTVVSRDTMEAIEGMMPPLVRPFVAGEQVVSFEPVEEADKDAAKQATEYVNHVFRRYNNPLHVAQTALKDGLLFRLGVAKTVVEEEEYGAPETYEGLDDAQLEALRAALQGEGRDLAGDIAQDPSTGLYGATAAPRKRKCYKVHVIAPDEFLREERLASLASATFLGHSATKTLADIIELGVDPEKAKTLRSGKPTEEQDDRFPGEDDEDSWADDDLARPVQVDECYIKCDYQGTGVLEWRKVLLGGAQSTLLSDEPAEDHPYSAWTPIPVPHKLEGLSIHDLTRDVQMQKTALQREQLNNLYLTNRPQREVLDGQVNIDDVLNPSVGGIIRVKSKDAMKLHQIPFVAEKTFGMIEYLDGVREARTGVTRYNQGMDADSLNKTATGMNIIASNSQQRQELVARQFGEFLKDIFEKLFALIKVNADPQDVERLTNKPFMPWPEEYDTTVSVGLGNNNKDQLVGHLMGLLQMDQAIVTLQGGVQGPILTAENIYEKLKDLAEAMGIKNDGYYTDPAQAPMLPPPVEEQADPLAEARIKQETELGKAQIQADTKLQVEAMKPPPVVKEGSPL